MTQWAHKILDDKGNIVFVTTVFPEGGRAFYYLLLSQANKSGFFSALKGTQEIELTEFGQVVRSGWGKPSEDDKEFMRKKYHAEV